MLFSRSEKNESDMRHGEHNCKRVPGNSRPDNMTNLTRFDDAREKTERETRDEKEGPCMGPWFKV